MLDLSTAYSGHLDLLTSHGTCPAPFFSFTLFQCEHAFAAQQSVTPLWDEALLTAAVARSSSTSCEIFLPNSSDAAADKPRLSVLTCVTVQACVMQLKNVTIGNRGAYISS